MRVYAGILCKVDDNDIQPNGHCTIPGNVRIISKLTFNSKENLLSVTFPEGLTTINDCAFAASNLSSVVIPAGVTIIRERAFLGCKNLVSATILPGITVIYQGTFLGCISLSSLSLPPTLRIIDWGAFSGCRSLQSVIIPQGTITIEDKAFSSCINLGLVILPESISTLHPLAFDNCPKLSTIVIDTPDKIKFQLVKNQLPSPLQKKVITAVEYSQLQTVKKQCLQNLAKGISIKIDQQFWTQLQTGSYGCLLLGELKNITSRYLVELMPFYQDALETLPDINIPFARDAQGVINWNDYEIRFNKVLKEQYNHDLTSKILFPATPAQLGLFATNHNNPTVASAVQSPTPL